MKFPYMRLSSCMKYCLENAGEFVLGGYKASDISAYTAMFADFWKRYENVDGSHCVFASKSLEERAYTIPFCLHGDEGRGLNKTPVMIESYQPLIPWMGENSLNCLGILGIARTFSMNC